MPCAECTLNNRPKVTSFSGKTPVIAFIGEAPGEQEVKQGVPFVGTSGTILRSTIANLGIPEDLVYFANVCMCKPPENRTPSAQEISFCLPQLLSELALIQPQYIVALGLTAGKALFSQIKTLKASLGIEYISKIGIPGVVTYHPAALLFPHGDTLLPTFHKDISKAWDKVNNITSKYSDIKTEVTIVKTVEQAAEILDILSRAELLSYDYETTGVKQHRDTAHCLGVAWEVGKAAVFPHRMIRIFIDEFRKIFSREDLTCIAFNAPFDSGFNARMNLPRRIDEDPMLQHYVLDERPQERNLEKLSSEWCDAPRYESDMLAKYNCTKADMIEKVPEDELYEYCGFDCDYALRLYLTFREKIFREEGLFDAYYKTVIPTARMVSKVAERGLWVNQVTLQEVTEEYRLRVENSLEKLREITEIPDFNPNSHVQTQKMLWDTLEFDEPEIYNRKERSADKETRKALKETFPNQPFVVTLDEYKTAYTMYSRYLRPLPQYIDSDGRIRASYHLDRTETGRLSTTKPALHQIPRESTIRNIFSAPDKHVLIQADYAQIEIRMAAHIANDTKLIELLKTGADFHTMMASAAFGVPLEKVTGEQRQAAKAVSFGLLYLMSEEKLAEGTGLPKKQAKDFVARYKALMPDVWKWIAQIRKRIKDQRYVESIFGRRRRFYLVTQKNLNGLHREGVNMPIQSSAADLTNHSAIAVDHKLTKYFPEANIVFLWHDAIYVECPENLAQDVGELVYNCMVVPPFKTEVPFAVDLKIGKHLGEGTKLILP